MLWFVEGTVCKSYYMGSEEDITYRGLIQADSYEQAVEKYREYWRSKTDEYSIYYSVVDYEITETIV